MAHVVVQKELDGSYTLKGEIGAQLHIVDMAAITADKMEAVRAIAQLITLDSAPAYAYAQELLTWLETNATVT